MIDQSLIEKSTKYAKDKLSAITGTEQLYMLDNFFYNPLLEKLIEYINSADSWKHDITYKNGLRTKINWESDSVIEETHIVFDNLTELLNNKFSRNNKFMGLNLWKDSPGYTIDLHEDNRVINLAIQIYLTEGVDNLGTVFFLNDNKVSVEYKKNSGYLADNKIGLPHKLEKSVPAGHVRYSVYGIWTPNLDTV